MQFTYPTEMFLRFSMHAEVKGTQKRYLTILIKGTVEVRHTKALCNVFSSKHPAGSKWYLQPVASKVPTLRVLMLGRNRITQSAARTFHHTCLGDE